jgi:hypothetical protein
MEVHLFLNVGILGVSGECKVIDVLTSTVLGFRVCVCVGRGGGLSLWRHCEIEFFFREGCIKLTIAFNSTPPSVALSVFILFIRFL